MGVTVRCDSPQCGEVLQVPDELRGKRGRCPACGHEFRVSGAIQAGQMSNDGRLICCDQAGGRHLGLIRRQGPERFVQLYEHGSSMVGQHTHPHPQFRPGRAQIVFSTDRAETGGTSGQSDIYLLELPPEIST